MVSIMFEIRAIIQWNKDIKNDVGSWKSALVPVHSFYRVAQDGHRQESGSGLLHNLMLTGL